MNRILAIASLTIATLALSTSAFAQQLKANIPFEFTVGNTTMPAGEYTISSSTRNVVDLKSANRTLMATVGGSQSYVEKKSNSAGELVFAKYGDTYNLRKVWTAGQTTGYYIVKTNTERITERKFEASVFRGEEVTLVASVD